jgi:hypothetical protein
MGVLHDRFIDDRRRLFKMIRKALGEDPYCKSYEGCLEVHFEYPDYFDDEEGALTQPTYCCITLHCYVLGSGRHHEFVGKSFKDALKKFESALDKWEREGE